MHAAQLKARLLTNLQGFDKSKDDAFVFREIPKIMHQTFESWEDVPLCCKEVIQKNKHDNKTWKHIFYDGASRVKEVRRFSTDAEHAYKKLKIPAMQADLFRLCVLYNVGGMYLDIKARAKNVDRVISDSDGRLVYLIWPYGKGIQDHPKHAATSILLWPRKHPVLKTVIESCVRRIEETKEPHRFVTDTTGPNMYAREIEKTVPSDRLYETKNYFDGTFEHDGTGGEYYRIMKASKRHWQNQVENYKGGMPCSLL